MADPWAVLPPKTRVVQTTGWLRCCVERSRGLIAGAFCYLVRSQSRTSTPARSRSSSAACERA